MSMTQDTKLFVAIVVYCFRELNWRDWALWCQYVSCLRVGDGIAKTERAETCFYILDAFTCILLIHDNACDSPFRSYYVSIVSESSRVTVFLTQPKGLPFAARNVDRRKWNARHRAWELTSPTFH